MEARERHINSIRKAYRSGVRLATGTDLFINSNEYNVYGLNGMEILLLINGIGLTPLEALEAATVNASYVAGLDHEVGIRNQSTRQTSLQLKETPRRPLTPARAREHTSCSQKRHNPEIQC